MRDDAIHDAYAERCQAKTPSAKWFYLFMHLAPGLFALCILNVEPLYTALRNLSGMEDRSFQYALFIFVTFGWHIGLPLIVLNRVDKLTVRETLDCLGLTRCDWKGCFIVLPLAMIPFTLISVPYYMWIAPPIQAWLETIPRVSDARLQHF